MNQPPNTREQWAATTLDSIGEGVITTDLLGAITMLNDAAEQLLGLPRDALIGQTADAVIGVIEDGAPMKLVARVLESRSAVRSKVPGMLYRRDGTTAVVESSASPIFSAPAVLEGVVVLMRDVSDRVQAMEKAVVADRLASLGTMASGIAHEINNPLAYVLANVEYTREELEVIGAALGETAETVRLPQGSTISEKLHALMESLQEATDGAKRVKNIVGDLRSFTLVKQAARIPFRLEDAVDRAVRISRSKAKLRAQMIVDIAPMPEVIGDESRLTQVLVNLIGNAVDAIPVGAPKDHEVRISAQIEPDGRIALITRDTGIGMSADVLRRAFDPFFTTKVQGTGMGLGLAICHRMVTDMGGELIPASTVDQGTTMTILLPRA